MCLSVCELRTRAVIIGAYRSERGRRRGARAGLVVSDRSWNWGGHVVVVVMVCGVGVVMSHPDSYGQSFTQPENIFHSRNTVHPIKLSINYFNPQIKDSTQCLIWPAHLVKLCGRADTVLVARSKSNCQHVGATVDFMRYWSTPQSSSLTSANAKINTTKWPIHPAVRGEFSLSKSSVNSGCHTLYWLNSPLEVNLLLVSLCYINKTWCVIWSVYLSSLHMICYD